MNENRIKISSIVENQLPNYVKEEFPLVSEFLSQYYSAIENQGNVLDLLQNIDKYVKVDSLTNLTESTTLTSSVSFFDSTINVSSTIGFPDTYGLIKINDEIITYKSKTNDSFLECVRGFSGIQSLSDGSVGQIKFSSTEITEHVSGSTVENLSIIFLKEFLNKVKNQFSPGFEDRQLSSEINQSLFIKQAKDFYSTKGTSESFEILFRALYGKDVEVILPRDYLIQPSDAQYRITEDLVVEAIEGDPLDLINLTLYQDPVYDINSSRGTISHVEKIIRRNKEYYVISLDFGYDNGLGDTGLTLGRFTIHPSTKTVVNTLSNSETLTVDSTVGFPNQGTLKTKLENGVELLVNYQSKSLNQFFECTGIDLDIPKGSEIDLDVYAYGYTDINRTQIVKVKVTGVLSDLIFEENTKYYEKGDIVKIKTLGKKSNDFLANNWIFNVTRNHNIKSITEIDSTNFKYRVELYDAHQFFIGDSITVIPPQGQPATEVDGVVSLIRNEFSFTIATSERLNFFTPYQIRKNIVNVSTINYSELNKYTANVQNTYISGDNSVYVTSNSIPHYSSVPLNIKDRKIIFSGSFDGYELTIPNHNLYSGDEILYHPTDSNNKLSISSGKYFVRRIDSNTIKISLSRNDLYNENYIFVVGDVTDNIFYYGKFSYENLSPKTVQSQKLVRHIKSPEESLTLQETLPGNTGIFINGVELRNYKSDDFIHYGPIEEIVVESGGSGYDVINPPVIQSSDATGFGLNAYTHVNGSLTRIEVIDGGINYLEKPILTIKGGNGFGASAEVNLKSYDYSASFNSTQSGGLVNLTNNTIGFSSYHNFINGEEIIYQTNQQQGIGGITTNSSYFVSIVDSNTIKLHTTLNDSLTGSNPLNLSLPYGQGVHTFRTKNKRNKIHSVAVINQGSNYRNRKISTTSVGINTINHTINIKNHGFSEKDIIVYQSSDDLISGLTTTKNYYVIKLDDDRFRLSEENTSNLDYDKEFFYRRNEYVKFTTVGSGIHFFKDQPIEITISATVGFTTYSDVNKFASLQPIFRGQVERIFIENGGSNYGTEDILNYKRLPTLEFQSGFGAEIRPVISAGSITDVIILNPGNNYDTIPDVTVRSSTGFGAILTPIIVNGSIVEIKIVSGGAGYLQENTEIEVASSEVGCKLIPVLKSWNVNLVERLINTNQISEDDGVIGEGTYEKFGLQYTHAYAPRNLRRSVLSKVFRNNEVIYNPDLIFQNGREVLSRSHSPIIGWSYDGHPIYGPYGFSSQTGGTIKLMKSGYEISLQENRPSLDLYPEGFFVEDYVYIGEGDLDENNGRYCVTPEFPNGTYAYFCTVSDVVSGAGQFSGFRTPVFPYVIGTNYNSEPNEFNFLPLNNQDEIDINQTSWIRNTTPYYLTSNNSSYEFLLNPNRIKENDSEIKSVKIGVVDKIDIINSGDNYSPGDPIIFDNEGTGGKGTQASVLSVQGKSISGIAVSTVVIDNIEISNNIGFSTIPLNISNGDALIVEGLYPNDFNISINASIVSNILTLSSGIGSAGYTGIVTYMNLYPPIRASVNDFYYLGDEVIKILNIDANSSRVRILRNQNNTQGVTSYNSGYQLQQLPTKFGVNISGLATQPVDSRQIYFNPIESVGLGTTSGPGIGLNIVFSNPGSGIGSIFIPTKSIYIPQHGLLTGTELIYNSNSGTPLSVSTDGVSSFTLENNSIVYAAKISENLVGISTLNVGVGSTGAFSGIGSTSSDILYFTGIGTGLYHSFKVNPSKSIKANIIKNTVTVTTTEPHGITSSESIFVDIKPKVSRTLTVKYDDFNRRCLVNPVSFTNSDVDVDLNRIKIQNNSLDIGQPVIYESNSLVGGLQDKKIYYVIPVGVNYIRLANSFNDAFDNKYVDLTSTGSGNISPVNPTIVAYKNNPLVFDLSDPSLSFNINSVSYSAFDLKIYKDPNFSQLFYKTSDDSSFSVIKDGRVGIDTTASVTIIPTDNFPLNLYYRLEPKNIRQLPSSKQEIVFDNQKELSGQIIFSDSILSGFKLITGFGTTSFSYSVNQIPENYQYNEGDGVFEYVRFFGTGKIKDIQIKSSGMRYKSLPPIQSIISNNGNNALLYSESNSIGSVNKSSILDIGFSYSSDYSVRPTAKLPEILKIYTLSIFDKIGISSIGRNYTVAPKLVVIDGKTNLQVPNVDLSYQIGDFNVSINKNTSGIYDVTPKIIPTNNSNGIGINSITYNPSTKDVTVFLGESYNSIDDFPFSVGGRVLLEGVGISSASEFKGYNSSDYNYALFTITQTDPNIGGSNGSITYNLSSYLNDGEEPGNVEVSGFIVPEIYFPIFDIALKKLSFYQGERINSPSASGIVQKWDSKNNNLKVITSEDFSVGEIIKGMSSGVSAVVEKIYNSEGVYDVKASSIVRKGWFKETGFLNHDTQRISDNDYYQYFSYSLRSEVPIDTWIDSVSSLNHTAGFKKFSDLIIESGSGFIGINTSQDNSIFSSTVDLYSTKSVHCFDDYDLVTENNVVLNGGKYSDQIKFNSRILQDYIESVGNRVLVIDDISSQFNSNPRPTNFSVVDTFKVDDYRSKKYLIYITDRRYVEEKESLIVTLLHDGQEIYLNQYAKVESFLDLGYFDFNIVEDSINLLFYPNKSKINSYNIELGSFGLRDSISGISTISFGDTAEIQSYASSIAVGNGSTTIVGIASTNRSAKVLVQIGATDKSYFEFNELNIIHNGSEVFVGEYGELSTGNYFPYSSSGLGTYHAYLDGSLLKVDYILDNSANKDYDINSVIVSIANTSSVGVGSTPFGGGLIKSDYVSIGASSSPISNVISQKSLVYNSSYYIVSIEDTTNNQYQLSELVVTNSNTESYITEYGTIYTDQILGEFDSNISSGSFNLLFTPNSDIDCQVRVFEFSLGLDETQGQLDLNNLVVDSSYGLYEGTNIDIKREFELRHNLLPIFERTFDGSNSNIVDTNEDSIYIPGHCFVTGEEVEYVYGGSPIGIATTTISGIGTTDKLPSTLYIVKVNDISVKVSSSASESLQTVPKILDLTSVGIGTTHVFYSKNQNSKSLITIDNVIQSPVVSTSTTAFLLGDMQIFDNVMKFTDTTEFFGGDLIRIGEEIMIVSSVGVGSTNSVSVTRPWMGTKISAHNDGDLVTKIVGNYNIVNNTISFADSPYGKVPVENQTKFDETDYIGITTSSIFNGRIFLRSGIQNSDNETYKYNYVFDDISNNFDGFTDTFTLKNNSNNVTGISTSNSILLINNVFQLPSRFGDVNVTGAYSLIENSGITSVSFVESATPNPYDVNISNLPRGGIIVSIASSNGFGYQPLVSAGGTAVVSIAGTIESISIGNSGSGYREGLQIVNVGVGTSSVVTPNIEFIGTAVVSGGHVVSIAITNPGSGYTSTNPPYVFFDSPFSYSNIPLVYSSNSTPGVGTEASVDIIVGQGSSVINFELKNFGYRYKIGEVLTLPSSGIVGIPTFSTSTFEEFTITVDEIYNDSFAAWTFGDLQVIDPVDSLFNGRRTDFPILINGNQTTIRSRPGSNINVEAALLVFINDVLQIPGEGYTFSGGSVINFTEPPNEGDTCKILFYKGTGDVDTALVDILEDIEVGDKLTINSDNPEKQQNSRLVTEIVSSDIAETSVYPGPGLSGNINILRPVTWCKQTSDILNGSQIFTKDRVKYEPYIYPVTNIIKNISLSDTEIFVESVKTFFDSADEYSQVNNLNAPQKKVVVFSQDNIVGASATAIVSIAGTISQIVITDGGFGYSTAPVVSLSSPVGIGTTFATATSSISSGIVTSIEVNYAGYGYTSTNPPQVLLEPPSLIFEEILNVDYEGDFGIITGIATTSVGVASTGLVFDFFVPTDSYLRDPNVNVVGVATTGISGIQTGYYFVLQNSNIGNGSVSLSETGQNIGIGTTYLDNVYKAVSVSIAQTSVPGIGITNVTKVVVSIDNYNGLSGVGYSGYFGNYSWGRLSGFDRPNPKEFEFYNNGLSGITTSAVVRRYNKLKYLNYTT